MTQREYKRERVMEEGYEDREGEEEEGKQKSKRGRTTNSPGRNWGIFDFIPDINLESGFHPGKLKRLRKAGGKSIIYCIEMHGPSKARQQKNKNPSKL